MSPCAANGFAPASGNSAYLWGAMLTQEGTTTTDQKLTAYIPTTSAAATRAAENFPLPYANIDPSAFNQNEGTYFADFLIPSGTFKAFNTPGVGFVTAGGTDWVQTGLQIGRSGLGRLPLTLALQTSIGTSSVYQTTATVYPNFAYDVPIKFATRFSRTKLVGICANGGAIAESTIVPPQYPGLPTNFMVSPCFGNYSTITASAAFIARRFAYFPRYLSADQMQQLTA
jgi:hypothetical protein